MRLAVRAQVVEDHYIEGGELNQGELDLTSQDVSLKGLEDQIDYFATHDVLKASAIARSVWAGSSLETNCIEGREFKLGKPIVNHNSCLESLGDQSGLFRPATI